MRIWEGREEEVKGFRQVEELLDICNLDCTEGNEGESLR